MDSGALLFAKKRALYKLKRDILHVDFSRSGGHVPHMLPGSCIHAFIENCFISNPTNGD